MKEPTKKCVCCGIGEVSAEENSFDICPVCDWEDDDVQNDDPDFAGGANTLSLKEHRKKFFENYKK